jgi:hypothetical protein
MLRKPDLISTGPMKRDPDFGSSCFEELNVLAEGREASLEALRSLFEFCLKVSFFPF